MKARLLKESGLLQIMLQMLALNMREPLKKIAPGSQLQKIEKLQRDTIAGMVLQKLINQKFVQIKLRYGVKPLEQMAFQDCHIIDLFGQKR